MRRGNLFTNDIIRFCESVAREFSYSTRDTSERMSKQSSSDPERCFWYREAAAGEHVHPWARSLCHPHGQRVSAAIKMESRTCDPQDTSPNPELSAEATLERTKSTTDSFSVMLQRCGSQT